LCQLLVVSDFYFWQGSVARRLRFGGIFNDYFITRLLLSPKVKEFFEKSVNIWQSYGQEHDSCFFLLTGYIWIKWLDFEIRNQGESDPEAIVIPC